MIRQSLLLIPLLVSAVVAGGCGSTEAHVSGDVTIDGQPLKQGVIVFVGGDGERQGEPARADIQGGKYALKMSAGEKKVQISAPYLVMGGGYELTRERLPSRYNSATTLEYDVKPGSQTKDWPTTTK